MMFKLLIMLWSIIIAIRAQTSKTDKKLDVISSNEGVMDQGSNISAVLSSTTAVKLPEGPPEDCPSCECGVSPFLIERIVNGTESDIEKFPWMVALYYFDSYYCGGTSINDLYVLTAAHCIGRRIPEFISVRFLDQDLSSVNVTMERDVVASIIHPHYNSETFNNDIALLKLDRRINFSMAESRSENDDEAVEVRPVCMPEPDLSYVGYDGTVIGWGRIGEGDIFSDTLLEVQLPVLSNEECNRDYEGSITDNMVCAGVPEGGRGVCRGDSGGPIQILDNSTQAFAVKQIGVVSWGGGCATPHKPPVFTRVSRYIEWIHNHTRDACYCD